MFSNLKQKYKSWKPETQHRATIAVIIGGVMAVASFAYFFTSYNQPKKVVDINAGPKKESLSLDNKILEKTVTAKNDAQNKELDDLKKQVAALQGGGQNQNVQPLASQPVVSKNINPLDQAIAVSQQKQPASPNDSSSPHIQKTSIKKLPPLPPPPNGSGSANSHFQQPLPPAQQGAYYPQASDPPPTSRKNGENRPC